MVRSKAPSVLYKDIPMPIFLSGALLGAIVIIVLIWIKLSNSNKQNDELKLQAQHLNFQLQELTQRANDQNKALGEQISHLQEQIATLSQYQGIVDADKYAKEIVEGANFSAESIKSSTAKEKRQMLEEAETALAKAKEEARLLKAKANEDAQIKRAQSESNLNIATIEAGKIVKAAHARAEEIAGEAYEAKKNAGLYERTITAIKNVIEGYGNKYLVPGHTLLDNLAEEFGHKEAGQELKRAQERTRYMIQNWTAATCDYVEMVRKETAINFAIDAFNGKVDSILSRVGEDNYGKLKQEIIDSYTLVNFNGKAFRDTRITEEFLQARLTELQWACSVQELKLMEKEEQRRIKDQIREEEKAKRDYERAIKEAEKEEETLKKAMEKIKKEVEKATFEQRSQFELQLQELAAKLKEAEEKNQRAVSMAQQTKTGHVYIISNIGSFGENIYKIGLTRRLDPMDRIWELGDASVPFDFDVHALIHSSDAPALEFQLHKRFIEMQVNKVNFRKEFFKTPLASIRKEIENMGFCVKWTMTAEALEYRETLAIEGGAKSNPNKELEWMARGEVQKEMIVTEE